MGYSGEEEGDFRFNNIEFSDRVLRLEISPALTSEPSEVSNTSESGATDLKIKKIHVISFLLAYKSQFFYKLFKNGMKETQQKDEVALRIDESEEEAFMDLLKFIYDHSVNASSGQDLLNVLMAADKFEVPSCVKYCVDLLHKLPMSTDLAFSYLELPSSVLADEVVKTLIRTAESFICAYFRDFKKYQEDALKLPLCRVELIIGSDGLQVDSEDDVFDFILKWGRFHYPKLEERQEILTRLLVNSICLPKMSNMKLKEVMNCSDFNSEKVMKPVINALLSTTNHKYPRRVYNHKVVKVVELQLARPRCVVYFDLTKDECANLVPHKQLYSRTFCLGGHKLSLVAQYNKEKKAIGLYMRLMEGSETFTLEYDFSVMKKSSKEYTRLHQTITKKFPITTFSWWGYPDPFGISWADFISDESEYFIDGILHIQSDITLIE